jgi:hypothetical protein
MVLEDENRPCAAVDDLTFAFNLWVSRERSRVELLFFHDLAAACVVAMQQSFSCCGCHGTHTNYPVPENSSHEERRNEHNTNVVVVKKSHTCINNT